MLFRSAVRRRHAGPNRDVPDRKAETNTQHRSADKHGTQPCGIGIVPVVGHGSLLRPQPLHKRFRPTANRLASNRSSPGRLSHPMGISTRARKTNQSELVSQERVVVNRIARIRPSHRTNTKWPCRNAGCGITGWAVALGSGTISWESGVDKHPEFSSPRIGA